MKSWAWVVCLLSQVSIVQLKLAHCPAHVSLFTFLLNTQLSNLEIQKNWGLGRSNSLKRAKSWSLFLQLWHKERRSPIGCSWADSLYYLCWKKLEARCHFLILFSWSNYTILNSETVLSRYKQRLESKTGWRPISSFSIPPHQRKLSSTRSNVSQSPASGLLTALW